MRTVVSRNEIPEVFALDLNVNQTLPCLLNSCFQGEQIESRLAGGRHSERLPGDMAPESAFLQEEVPCSSLHVGQGLGIYLLFSVKFRAGNQTKFILLVKFLWVMLDNAI